MPRKILTPEGKKAAARKVFDRYKTYTGEAGSPEHWAAAAEDVVYHRATPRIEEGRRDPLLVLLGLDEMPRNLAELRGARRRAMLSAHADKGGSHEKAVEINAAYDKIKAKIRI